MVKLLIGTCIVLAASFAAWGIILKTHPVFVATEALEASRKAGVLTEEMSAEVDHEDFKSALVTFSIWGGFIGLAFAIASPMSKAKLPLRIVIGLVLGLVGGLAAAYISNRYARFSEPPLDFGTYWLIRWSVVLLPLIAALGVSVSITTWNTKNLIENIVRIGVGAVLAVCIYVFSMGLLTPIEQAQYIFPGFKENSALLMASVGALAFVMLSVRTGKRTVAEGGVGVEAPLNNTP
ncbi:MAG: hypothetical protein MUC43_06470 [Pirellula sp.]|jgi:hypothetical protein|nr:hypothetical protein [Pirellula sp.]